MTFSLTHKACPVFYHFQSDCLDFLDLSETFEAECLLTCVLALYETIFGRFTALGTEMLAFVATGQKLFLFSFVTASELIRICTYYKSISFDRYGMIS